jgi:hypothetical protein
MARQPWAQLVCLGSDLSTCIDLYEDELHFGNAGRMPRCPEALPRPDGDTMQARLLILMLARRAASESAVHTVGRFAHLGPDLLMHTARSVTPTFLPSTVREVLVNNCRISASHCKILRRGAEAVVVDTSSNGTWWNGIKMARSVERRLTHTDHITLLQPSVQPQRPAVMLPVRPGALVLPPAFSYTFLFRDLRLPPLLPGLFQPRLVRQNAFIGWPPGDTVHGEISNPGLT